MADVANLRSVQFVIRRGLVFELSAYRPIMVENIFGGNFLR